MGVVSVAQGIHRVSQGYVNAYLVESDDGVALVDAGLAKRVSVIRASLGAIRRRPDDLRHILVTHHHVDHAGGLAALAEETGATVWAHPGDAVVIRGDIPSPGPSPVGTFSKMLAPLVARLGPALVPSRVDRELADGDEIPFGAGVRVLHTPGHTRGHVCFLLGGTTLFVGDAAGNLFGRLGPPLGMFTEDHAEMRRSIRRISEVEFETACFGHGPPIIGGGAAKFRRLSERLGS